MLRSIELAERGAGFVSPNPLVGCVIVHQEKIIGEGFHQRFGEAHAEVNAIRSVKNKALLKDSTLYVTLEPCCHHGKTPPCTDLIIQHKIPRVVIGSVDPYEKVSGLGIVQLRNAGIDVQVGLMESETNWLNRRFFTFVQKKRPYIILKWAESADHFLAPDASAMSAEAFNEKRHITGFIVQKLVHRWRSIEDAILVGTNTIISDNPSLNVRAWEGRNPLRIAIDRQLRIPLTAKIYDRSQQTLIFNEVKDENTENLRFVRMDFQKNSWPNIFQVLFDSGIQSLIVEGGAYTLNNLILQNYWDEMQVFTTPKYLHAGVKAPEVAGQSISQTELDASQLRVYVNPQAH
jgi:diaminohydroxyphosphoribosylaminopyrimidine deaminase/5-amino-6-(5-phosphoribosylamino)uracil reductase